MDCVATKIFVNVSKEAPEVAQWGVVYEAIESFTETNEDVQS